MVDTVVLEIHNLKVHEQMYRELIQGQQDFSTMTLESKNPLTKASAKKWLDRDIIFFERTGKALEKFRRVSRHVKSSHYTVHFLVDPVEDMIKVNFSIPKYFFGTNIVQAVPHYTDNDFSQGSPYDQWSVQAEKFYPRFKKYIKGFFIKEFGFEPDYKLVRLMRLDLCFNLLFPSKEFALSYLDGQRKIKKKYTRDNTDTLNNYETAFFYRNSDYSFKIYHKGTEYGKNDRPKHDKINMLSIKKTGKITFDTGALQDLADRSLRFEMSFFTGYMSKLLNLNMRRERDFFGKYKNYNFNKFRFLYNKIHAVLQTTKEIKAAGVEIKVSFFLEDYKYFEEIFALMKKRKMSNKVYTFYTYFLDMYVNPERLKNGIITPYQELKMLKEFYNHYSNFISKSHRFMLYLDKEQRQEFYEYCTTSSSLESSLHSMFNSDLFLLMSKKFWDTVLSFKLSEAPPLEVFKESLRAYNSKHGKIIDEQKAILLYFLVERGFKLHTMRSTLGLSKTMYYRYVKAFEYCGFTQGSTSVIYSPFYDFSQYYLEISQEKYRSLFADVFRF